MGAQPVEPFDAQPGRLRPTLTALARAYLDTVVSPEGIALFRVVVAEAPRFPQLAETFYRVGPQAVVTHTAERLAHACDAGLVDLNDTDIHTAAESFIGLVRSKPQQHYLLHPHVPPSVEDIHEWVALAVTLFLRAYGVEQVDRQWPASYRISRTHLGHRGSV
jgi:hypothetical protein